MKAEKKPVRSKAEYHYHARMQRERRVCKIRNQGTRHKPLAHIKHTMWGLCMSISTFPTKNPFEEEEKGRHRKTVNEY
jgi:hypothetical protein